MAMVFIVTGRLTWKKNSTGVSFVIFESSHPQVLVRFMDTETMSHLMGIRSSILGRVATSWPGSALSHDPSRSVHTC